MFTLAVFHWVKQIPSGPTFNSISMILKKRNNSTHPLAFKQLKKKANEANMNDRAKILSNLNGDRNKARTAKNAGVQFIHQYQYVPVYIKSVYLSI